MTCFAETGLNTTISFKLEMTRCSDEQTCSCNMSLPVKMFNENISEFDKTVKLGYKVPFDI